MPQTIPLPDIVPLFAEMRAELLRILRALPDEAWSRESRCPGWSVRDVALHLLGDDIGYLSNARDGDGVLFPGDDWEELVRLINGHNDLWVRAGQRISRTLLLSLLEFVGDQVWAYFASLDLNEPVPAVEWAGGQATVWLRVARQLTEYWMHHQHISEALGITSLKERRFLHPVLVAFVHALPRTYAAVDAPPNTTIHLQLTGEAADDFYLVRHYDGWRLYGSADAPPATGVTMDGDTAWRLFTKGIDPATAPITITGDERLGRVLLGAVAIIA